ncbi:aminopeptidase [Methanobrevibacter cuticularis]|uniref:Aminopeptidase n=1 Tax=Methanobrevibacter cuticularis TaxID=47311 RepID=A0A166E4C3_9EURY|nr:aminopeptidase P family protein [Methanobrevibacter cuticularis]KZX16266.1 aminopeptidase [Methanobrevibacter cuticularis]
MNEKKLKSILEKIHDKNYDCMILTQFNNIRYISNYAPTSFAICLLKDDPIILTSSMDKELAEKTSEIPVEEFKSFNELKKLFEKDNFKKIAIESSISISLFRKIEGNWDLNIEDFLEKERMIKSKDEITKLEKAAGISHKSFKELNPMKKREDGFTEWELAYELGYLLRKNGAEKESFETIIATGTNSSLPHARTQNKKLQTPILMDWGCKAEGYCSDTTRTFVYSEKQEEIFDIVFEAHNKAIKSVKAGIKSCEIDKIARSIISEYGYEKNFIHSTGHSLGLDIHEIPSISKKDETILEKNMVITIEPGIYLEGNFGVRIEDTIIVGKNKAEIIGNLPYSI